MVILSTKLCGVTHISYTREARAFVLLSEEGVAKGIRRVTAVTKACAFKAKGWASSLEQEVREASTAQGSHQLEGKQRMNAAERTSRHDGYPPRRKTPSFSSTLLDSIFRSIDEPNGVEEQRRQKEQQEEFVLCKQTATMRRKHSSTGTLREELAEEEFASRRRAIMHDRWMETRSNSTRNSRHVSSSSDSSSGGGTLSSSSETESSAWGSTPKSSILAMQRQNQARPGVLVQPERSDRAKKFMKTTRSRALKLYGDLKKVKQPMSPGGRISTFLNSIFNSSNVKKQKLEEGMSSFQRSRSVKDSTATCFSASRSSCLSKSRLNCDGSKRTVKFYPVSVIVGEDSQPCGHKSIYEGDPSLMPLPNLKKNQFMGKSTVAREFKFRGFHENDGDNDDDNDYDDAESCSSSDLFELEINGVGIGAYREELPVYGTTSLKTNQAIAHGFIL
ncbi:hypothetical protein RJ640_012990 [Escallonia rubra]|uniref:Threonyl/alanyl tRNA synthetase SAD domain-containing protein n=1 Tax=Escallonia rubra TaxID=112253 RepID=A0AA88U956_9ASTE|nr:hypothetical protein RJ640_012990 [Escallonia rubra]